MLTRSLLLAAAVAVAITAAAEPPASTRFVTASPSRLMLEGSSNVAPWRCSGVTIDAQAEVGAPIAKINEVIDRVQDGNIGPYMNDQGGARFPAPEFALSIPVQSLRCGNSVMERDLANALRADENPTIEFKFLDVVGVVTHDIDTHDYHATIAGELSLAGAKRTIEVTVTAQRLARDRFRLRAELPLRMTDFRVKPPTALLGMIKARDQLVVRFDLVLQTRGNRS